MCSALCSSIGISIYKTNVCLPNRLGYGNQKVQTALELVLVTWELLEPLPFQKESKISLLVAVGES